MQDGVILNVAAVLDACSIISFLKTENLSWIK